MPALTSNVYNFFKTQPNTAKLCEFVWNLTLPWKHHFDKQCFSKFVVFVFPLMKINLN